MATQYPWAANKQKLLRSIAFVNAGLGEQKKSDEEREQMVREYYEQIKGLIIAEPAPKRGRPKSDEASN